MKFILLPRLSQLTADMVSIHKPFGGPGHNIPCDLHIEHLNRVLKDRIKGLGATTVKLRKQSPDLKSVSMHLTKF